MELRFKSITNSQKKNSFSNIDMEEISTFKVLDGNRSSKTWNVN